LEGLQTVEEERNEFEGQDEEDPVQDSATSQTPLEDLQTVDVELKWQEEVQQDPPSHCSPVSTIPFPQTDIGEVVKAGAIPVTKKTSSLKSPSLFQEFEEAPPSSQHR
jgi:hypothetical protein